MAMKKQAEIDILTEIELLLNKLIMNAQDGYMKEFITPYLDSDDMFKMMQNIRNDFPPLLNTKIETHISRHYSLYKDRLILSHKRAFDLANDLKSARLFIADQGETMGQLRDLHNEMIERLVQGLIDCNSDAQRELIISLLMEYPDQFIIEKKLALNCPLDDAEKKFLTDVLNRNELEPNPLKK